MEYLLQAKWVLQEEGLLAAICGTKSSCYQFGVQSVGFCKLHPTLCVSARCVGDVVPLRPCVTHHPALTAHQHNSAQVMSGFFC